MWLSPGLWPDSKCSTTVVGCSCSELKPCQHEIANLQLTKSKTTNLMETHWRVQQKWPRGCREFQHLAGVEPILPYSLRFTLSTEPSVFIDLSKKHSTSLIIFSSLDPIFCMQDCHCLIALVEDQGQTRYQNT